MGIRISKRDGKLDHNAVCSCVVIFLCVREECYLVLWCFHKWSSIFSWFDICTICKIVCDYFFDHLHFFYLPCVDVLFFQIRWHNLQVPFITKMYEIKQMIYPIFPELLPKLVKNWKTRSNTLMASNFGNNKLSLFVSWASFDVCMDIPLGETLFLKNIYLRMTWSK